MGGGQSDHVRKSAADCEIYIHVLWVLVRQAVSAHFSWRGVQCRLVTAERQVVWSHRPTNDRLSYTRPRRRTVAGKIRIQYCDVTRLDETPYRLSNLCYTDLPHIQRRNQTRFYHYALPQLGQSLCSIRDANFTVFTQKLVR